MGIQARFPVSTWVVRKLTGRWARRALAVLVLALLCFAVASHIRSYLMVRRIQAVLRGLSELRIDQTSESELQRTVPYLVRSTFDRTAGGSVRRWYYAGITNASDRLMSRIISSYPWGEQVANWLGYRFIAFDAGVIVQDGKVRRISYGVSKHFVLPLQPGYIVSANSFHGIWAPYSSGFSVSSQDDFSPQFRIGEYREDPWVGHGKVLRVTFSNDAPPDQVRQVFQLKLGCFWKLLPCGDARDIAPQLWRAKQAIDNATTQQLNSGKCPDSIIRGRIRYLPDVSVVLLEVTGSRRLKVNEEGETVQDLFTDYRLKEVIRGRPEAQSWDHVRFQQLIPSPSDPTRTMANPIWPPTKVGTQVLFFGTHHFYTCRFIPATPSALEIIRNTPTPPKRSEDEVGLGIQ